MDTLGAPTWSECASPHSQSYGSNTIASPGYSDNNHYMSPAVSPGEWNVVSPNRDHFNYSSRGSSTSGSLNDSTASVTPWSTQSSSGYNELELTSEFGKESDDKNDVDIRREKIAHARAQALFEEAVGVTTSKSPQPFQPEQRVRNDSGSAVQEAASRRYEERKRVAKAGLAPPSLFQPNKEGLASSTRKKTSPTEEEDFETIEDFKCQFDIDREKSAGKKALALLYTLPGCA